MKNKVIVVKSNESFKRTHNVINDICPICNQKFIVFSNIVKLGNVAYDLECYYNSTGTTLKIK